MNKLNILINECSARVYPLPRDSNDLIGKLIQTQRENSEAERILISSRKKLNEYSLEWSRMEENTGTTKFNRVKGKLLFVGSVLEAMTTFRNTEHFLVGKFWLPESGTTYIEEALNLLSDRKEFGGFRVMQEKLKKNEKPPTKFFKNELLFQYQKIVDTYGVPRYKEINPAVISSVSFPFLFGMMFGDIAHGFILLLFGIFTFLRGRKLADLLRIEHLEMRSLGVLLVMMGFFAVYAGLVYNDFLALPVTIVDSCYVNKGDSYGKFVWLGLMGRTEVPILSMGF
jgi:V-type H+-transporting ATPase subunit a